ncbi:hypothetical protein KIPB_017345, partial [Kipferlia bialata]
AELIAESRANTDTLVEQWKLATRQAQEELVRERDRLGAERERDAVAHQENIK